MSRLSAIDGKPIVDAKRPVMLRITKNDVLRADVKKPQSCAAARACRRELKAHEARVHLSKTYVRFDERGWVRFETSKPLRAEIIAFDRGGQFEPGEYRLGVPPKPTPPDKLGTRKARGTNRSPRSLLHHITKNVRTGPA